MGLGGADPGGGGEAAVGLPSGGVVGAKGQASNGEVNEKPHMEGRALRAAAEAGRSGARGGVLLLSGVWPGPGPLWGGDGRLRSYS